MSAEEYIEIGYLAKESIKASTSKMSPEEGNKLIQAGITTTPREALKGYSIPCKGDMFSDSIRESPTPNEASQVKTYYNPTGTSTQVETGKSSCKLTGTDTAKGGYQVQHSDTQNHEVMALTNNVQKVY